MILSREDHNAILTDPDESRDTQPNNPVQHTTYTDTTQDQLPVLHFTLWNAARHFIKVSVDCLCSIFINVIWICMISVPPHLVLYFYYKIVLHKDLERLLQFSPIKNQWFKRTLIVSWQSDIHIKSLYIKPCDMEKRLKKDENRDTAYCSRTHDWTIKKTFFLKSIILSIMTMPNPNKPHFSCQNWATSVTPRGSFMMHIFRF